MQVNSAVLLGIRSRRDITLLTDSRRLCLVEAVQAAAELVARAARGAEYAKLRYGKLDEMQHRDTF